MATELSPDDTVDDSNETHDGDVDVDAAGAPPASVPAGAEAEATIEALEDRLRRALADLDNLRKRFDREVAVERAAERARMAAAWLPVIDNLDLALDHAAADPGAIVEGVRLVRDQALTVMSRFGFPRFDDTGKPFDPLRHQAVAAIESDQPPGTVVATVRPGYGSDETILRPASVIVAREPD